MRLGVFGGTFDPPHIGHLVLAAEAADQLQLDKILWVLTPNPPHKTDRRISPLETRLGLVYAALEDNPAFELARVDIDRPPPHYAVDTLSLLRRTYPQAKLTYLMGADSLDDLPTWHTPQAFLEAVDSIGVMRRMGEGINLDSLESQLPGASAKVQFVDAPLLEISSTDIRQRVSAGRPVRYLLPEAVWRKLATEGLYQME